MTRPSHIANRLATTISRMLGGEAAGGVILILAAIAAIIAANSSLQHAYHDLFHGEWSWTPVPKLNTLHLWINDGLMAVFFFVVGLEIKREVLDGALADAKLRRLPIMAAAAGMAIPALIYLLIAGFDGPAQRGWAIPAATDIAFAVGVLGLLGKRVPPSLRLFLLTVAIVDDLGAVVIIALFYTTSIKLIWGLAAVVTLAALIAANRLQMSRQSVFVGLGLILWLCVLHSGIHATIAGVVLAFTIPLKLDGHGDSMLLRLEHALVPWNSYLIVPLFGFANAGVALAGMGLRATFDPVPLGVALGLFLGKQAGVFGTLVAADRIGVAPKPDGATWTQLWGMSVLCGIGFTMSLFIGALAFPDQPQLIEEAKLGVLAGSVLAALLGYAILRLSPKPA